MPLYIEKINGDVNRPTDQPTDQPTDRVNIEQSAFFESQKIEKRQRVAIFSSAHRFGGKFSSKTLSG